MQTFLKLWIFPIHPPVLTVGIPYTCRITMNTISNVSGAILRQSISFDQDQPTLNALVSNRREGLYSLDMIHPSLV